MTHQMDKHFSINVMGKVQGVFFRASAREKAEELITQGRWSDLYVVHLIGFAFLKLHSLRL